MFRLSVVVVAAVALLLAIGVRAVDQTPATSQSVYVNLGGSDTLGDGSNTNPYGSVSHAMSTITDAQQNKKYSIELGAGSYVETGLVLKPWVFVIGRNYEATFLSITDGTKTVELDPSFVNGGNRAGFSNLYLNHGTGIHFDLAAIGGEPTPSAVFSFQDVYIGGSVNITGRVQNIDYVEADDVLVFGDLLLDSLNLQLGEIQVLGSLVLSASQSALSGSLDDMAVGGSLSVVSATDPPGPANTPQFVWGAVAGAITFDGPSVLVELDGLITPALPTTLNGATYHPGSAIVESWYHPANPYSWTTPPPQTVSEALDRLAAMRPVEVEDFETARRQLKQSMDDALAQTMQSIKLLEANQDFLARQLDLLHEQLHANQTQSTATQHAAKGTRNSA